MMFSPIFTAMVAKATWQCKTYKTLDLSDAADVADTDFTGPPWPKCYAGGASARVP